MAPLRHPRDLHFNAVESVRRWESRDPILPSIEWVPRPFVPACRDKRRAGKIDASLVPICARASAGGCTGRPCSNCSSLICADMGLSSRLRIGTTGSP